MKKSKKSTAFASSWKQRPCGCAGPRLIPKEFSRYEVSLRRWGSPESCLKSKQQPLTWNFIAPCGGTATTSIWPEAWRLLRCRFLLTACFGGSTGKCWVGRDSGEPSPSAAQLRLGKEPEFGRGRNVGTFVLSVHPPGAVLKSCPSSVSR